MNRRAILKGALGGVAGLALPPFARGVFAQASPTVAPVSDGFVMLTGTTAGLAWAKASRAKGGRVRPAMPPNAPFSIDLRFMSLLPCGSWPIPPNAQTPAITPVLSPKLFVSRPALFSSVRCRLEIVVRSGSSICRPPLSAPAPPPTRMFGNG